MPVNTYGVEDLKPEEWETLFKMYYVLGCTKLLTTQAHYESAFTGAFGPLIQHTLITSTSFNSLSIIDNTRVKNIPTVWRGEKPFSDIS